MKYKIVSEVPPEVHKDTLVSIDTEFFGQDKRELHIAHGQFACISITMDSKTVYQLYDEKQIAAALKAVSKGTWVFHNAMYDIRQLRRFATIKPRFIWDTMLLEQSLFGGYYKNFSLKDLVRRWLGIAISKDVRGEFEDAEVMTPEMKKYAAEDVIHTLNVLKKQLDEFQDSIYLRAYLEVDERCIFPILDMPGMMVDAESWLEMAKEFEAKGSEIEDELDVNVFSSKKVLVAAKKHGLHLQNTMATTLEAFKDNTFVRKVLEARMYRKAATTYGTRWVEKNVQPDKRVYCNYKITGAATGRMSASSPNMQQIPQRKLPQYRKLFIASPGNVIMVYDVVQQEPCILAHESQDTELLRAIRAGEDLHLTVARAVFGDPSMKKEDPRRHVGKTVNLGTSYGLTEYGLAVRLDITEQEAAGFLNQYFARFRGVFGWINTRRQEALQKGYVLTASKRRLFLNTHDKHWQNNAINAPIQGGAADFTKAWVYRFWKACNDRNIAFPLVAIVHDEIVLDVPKAQAKLVRSLIEDSFDAVAKDMFPGVPFRVEGEQGKSWACKTLSSELEDEDDASDTDTEE